MTGLAGGTAHLRRLERRGHFGIKCGLENIRALLEALDRPDRACPVVILAGTNGKGSTGAFLAHMLRACGLRIGWTTSPHLSEVRERIWIDGGPVAEADLDALLGEVFEVEARIGIQATYFELVIAAALLAFRRSAPDLVLLEVGMGGRWDATNATDPAVTVLTTVGLDHQQYLGTTREAIAREKLCTARDGRPLVLGPSLDPHWIRPLLPCAPQLRPAPPLASPAVHWDHSVVDGHRLGLPGRHQVDNLATAFEAARCLREVGFDLPDAKLWLGATGTHWPGRLWEVPGLSGVWMDGAHNPEGARVLADHALACGVAPHLFFGAMGDKDLAGVATELRRMGPRSVTFIRGEADRYATAPQLGGAWGLPPRVLTLAEAAAVLEAPAEAPRLVTGSLYLLGDLLGTLGIHPF